MSDESKNEKKEIEKVETGETEIPENELEEASGGKARPVVTAGWDILKQAPFAG